MLKHAVDGFGLAAIHALAVVTVIVYSWNRGYDAGYSEEQAERWAKSCTIINQGSAPQ